MLFWLHVGDVASPPARDPDRQVQPSLSIDLMEDDLPALKPLKLDPQLLGYLSLESFLRPLPRQDVTAREIPYIRIPPPFWRPVTQKHLICLVQDHGNDVMLFHQLSMTQ